MENVALIPYEEVNLDLAFADKESIDAVLAKVKVAAEAHVPDTSTEEGRKAIASNSYKVSRCKTWLVKYGKEKNVDAKNIIDTNNLLIKRVETFCDDLRDSTRKPLTDLEEAEKADRERRRLEKELMKDWKSAIEYNDLLDRETAIAAKEAELKRLEDERIAKEQTEQAERNRVDRENKIAEDAAHEAALKAKQAINDAILKKREAEERIILEKERADRELVEAAERALRDKQAAILAAEERAKEEAASLEMERLAAIAEKERLAAEAKKKADRLAANRNHRKKVNKEAAEGFAKNCAVDLIVGMAFVEAIEKSLIPHVSIKY